MKTIMVDVDGVLADFMLSWRTLANKLYGVEVYKTGAPQYDNWVQADLTPAQQERMWEIVKGTPLWWYDVAPLVTEEEVRLLRALDDVSNLYFVTARVGATAREQTAGWLRRHFDLESPTVIVSKWKGEVAVALEAYASIDDKAENAWSVAQRTRGRTRSYLLDRPYNQVSEERWRSDLFGPGVTRVSSVLEFLGQMKMK